MPVNSANTSIPRLRYLWLVASIVLGYGLVDILWPSRAPIEVSEFRAYASVLVTAAATMSTLAFAGAALLYALLAVSMVKALHDVGALNRVVFDLLACAGLWLVSLGAALIASMPFVYHPATAIIVSTSCACAGILYFLPLGHAFWLLLSNAPKPVAPPISHDWSSPTVLHPVDTPKSRT